MSEYPEYGVTNIALLRKYITLLTKIMTITLLQVMVIVTIKINMGVVYPCIGIKYWIGSYKVTHDSNQHGGGLPMDWDYVLDWVI